MSNSIYWIWLQQRLGAGAKTQKLLDYFEGDIKAVFEAESYPPELNKYSDKLADKELESSNNIIDYCNLKGYKILTPCERDYPDSLREIPDYPCALYVCGEIDFNREPMIALVGARKASYYGLNVATRLSYSLSVGGVTVVSGGALGTDSAAHKGSLLAGKKTVMVLGCGLDGGYLKDNAELFEAVKRNGAVVSEFPPETKASRFTFPIRNRLIAALCLATVVVQAGVKSGSLITARLARQYGRDVFGVPGGIYNKDFQGVNELIRDGAGVVTGVSDILESYAREYPERIDLKKAVSFDITDKELIYEEIPKTNIEAVDEPIELNMEVKKRLTGLSAKARLVYDSLETGPKHINEISTLTSLSQAEVLSELTSLELMDAVMAVEGRKYRAI